MINFMLNMFSKNNLFRLLKLASLAALVLVTVTHGPEMHYKYLENTIGRVTVKALKDDSGVSGGTGFYIKAPSGKSYILTNNHLCGKAINEIVYIKHETGDAVDRIVPRRIIDSSEEKDLCLIEGYGAYDGVELASSVSRGSLVWVVGHPRLNNLTVSFGQLINMDYEVILLMHQNRPESECSKSYMEWRDLRGTTAEMFGVLNVCVKKQAAFQSNAVIHPGNSGSAVVNALGNVVAVAFVRDKAGFSYMIKLEDVRKFLDVY